MIHRIRTTVLVLLLSFSILPHSTQATTSGTTIPVTTTADTLLPDGLCSLREAVQAANSDSIVDACPAGSGEDTILLPAGVFNLALAGRDEDLNQSGDLDVRASLTLLGSGTTETVIDANRLDRVMQIFSPAVVHLDGLTLQGGDAGQGLGPAYAGGGISLISGSSLTLENARLNNNLASNGGGLYNNGGTVEVKNSLVEDNQAETAAGIYNGGILSVQDSILRGNLAGGYAGGLHSNAQLNLSSSAVYDNQAGTNGGGIYITLGDAEIINSTIYGNRLGGYMGGGLWVYYQAHVTVTHSTISGNQGGSGVYNYHEGAPGGTQDSNILIANSLLAENTPGNCGRSANAPPIGSLGGNLDSGATCAFDAPGDLADTDPLTGPLQDNGGATPTLALLNGSPAIDSAVATSCPASDQRGVIRPQGAGCDIGAYEYRPGDSADLSLGLSAAPSPVQVGAALTYTLSVMNAGPEGAVGLQLVDDLPDGSDYTGASGTGWACEHISGRVTCSRDSLAAGAQSTLTIQVSAVLTSTVMTNSAVVASRLNDPDLRNNSFALDTPVVHGQDHLLYLAVMKK